MYDVLIGPFADYAFMRRALAVCLMIALGGTPLGVFMAQRRLSLAGDAMSHAILPGAAGGFIFFGLSTVAMSIGAFVAGVLVSGFVYVLNTRTRLKEDAAFALTYMLALAAGVSLVSASGAGVDLLHLLFGDILGIGHEALYLVAGVACLSIVMLLGNFRALVVECFDSDFYATLKGANKRVVLVFYVLVVLNLVASFQVLGTLMALGLIIMPAIAGRFWVRGISAALALSIILGAAASYAGLLLSYHYGLPPGPAVVLMAGAFCLLSAFVGPQAGRSK